MIFGVGRSIRQLGILLCFQRRVRTMWIGVGSMGERLFTEMRVIWRLEVLALGRLTVPPTPFCWLPALTPPTLAACRNPHCLHGIYLSRIEDLATKVEFCRLRRRMRRLSQEFSMNSFFLSVIDSLLFHFHSSLRYSNPR